MDNLWLIALATLLGIVTHVAKRLRDEQVAMGNTMSCDALKAFISAYFAGHFLELVVMLLLVLGAIFLLHQLGELSLYNAYLTGFAGNSLSDATGRRAKDLMERSTPPRP
jgi:hypothetical protein